MVKAGVVTGSAMLAMSLGIGAGAVPQGAQGQAPVPQQKPEQVILVTPPMPEQPNNGLGDTERPLIPGQPWRGADLNRPKPVTVTPGRHPGDPPADAVVLFDGKDLSQWNVGAGRGAAATPASAPAPTTWKVENGYMEVTPGAGSLTSKERFKDFQLHLEFATPAIPMGFGQYRGNSGLTIGGREFQILDNYNNATYADGYAMAVYGQWPPLANPALPPGQWQTIDIAYIAARYESDRLVRNPFITIFLNGVMVQNNREIQPAARGGGAGRAATPVAGGQQVQAARGAAVGGGVAAGGGAARNPAIPPGEDQPIGLMGHPSAIPGNAIRYRNIWARRVQVELPSMTTEPTAATAGRGRY